MTAVAMEFVHCCKILSQERDYSMVSSLREETEALMEQFLCHEIDLSLYPTHKFALIILYLKWSKILSLFMQPGDQKLFPPPPPPRVNVYLSSLFSSTWPSHFTNA
ncbi:hypothetical protein BsWGS_05232 [Bradybaena similaris]